ADRQRGEGGRGVDPAGGLRHPGAGDPVGRRGQRRPDGRGGRGRRGRGEQRGDTGDERGGRRRAAEVADDAVAGLCRVAAGGGDVDPAAAVVGPGVAPVGRGRATHRQHGRDGRRVVR